MAEVRPKGGDSGGNALENRVLGLNEAFLNAFCSGIIQERSEEDLFSVSLDQKYDLPNLYSKIGNPFAANGALSWFCFFSIFSIFSRAAIV